MGHGYIGDYLPPPDPEDVIVNSRTMLTAVGGVATLLENNTGSPSVKGEIVSAGTTTGTFRVNAGDGPQPLGAVYTNAIPNGMNCWVVYSGPCDVLLEDATATNAGNWVYVSNVAGRADGTLSGPPGGGIPELDVHMGELGHSVQTTTAGTNKLSRIILHPN